jgi:hypothetical protein
VAGEIGNKKVGRHGLHLVTFPSTLFILDPPMSFMESDELQRIEADVPETIIDFLKSDVLPGTHHQANKEQVST